MYYVKRLEMSGNYQNLEIEEGFLMASRGKGFNVEQEVIKNINIKKADLAHKVVSEKVLRKYHKLINLLAELLISDDDSGESFREALNQIEKFRLEVKIKYRNYLKKKELEMMSKQLALLKKEADRRLLEIAEVYYASKSSGKGK